MAVVVGIITKIVAVVVVQVVSKLALLIYQVLPDLQFLTLLVQAVRLVLVAQVLRRAATAEIQRLVPRCKLGICQQAAAVTAVVVVVQMLTEAREVAAAAVQVLEARKVQAVAAVELDRPVLSAKTLAITRKVAPEHKVIPALMVEQVQVLQDYRAVEFLLIIMASAVVVSEEWYLEQTTRFKARLLEAA